jgi:hypothetical protein
MKLNFLSWDEVSQRKPCYNTDNNIYSLTIKGLKFSITLSKLETMKNEPYFELDFNGTKYLFDHTENDYYIIRDRIVDAYLLLLNAVQNPIERTDYIVDNSI